jgi:NADH pyrophosphatase NudC (nudix superfamily)
MAVCSFCKQDLVLFYISSRGRSYYICLDCYAVKFNCQGLDMTIKAEEALVTLPSEVFEFYNQAKNVAKMEDYDYFCVNCHGPSYKKRDSNNFVCLKCGFEWEVLNV